MKLLLPSDIDSLLENRPGPCLSFYVPTSPPGARTRQGPIRFRNLLRSAGAELARRGLDEAAIEALLGPLEDLAVDSSFWNTREVGVAAFRAPGFTQVFHLPRDFAERYVVADAFFLKPLLPLVAGADAFYVLALSQNEVRLLEATCQAVRRLDLPGLPHSLTEALGEQKTPQYLTYHTASSSGTALPAVYHGQGVGVGDAKEELRRYVRQIETSVREALAGRAEPMVLAGAEPLPFLFREITSYPHVAAPVILGNPEHSTDEELRDRAWEILQPDFQEARRRAAERFDELAGTGRASNDVMEILPAAVDGRVETLFLACDADLWGRLGPLEHVEIHAAAEEGDEDLLDAAALLSLRHGGTVYGLDRGGVPGGGDLAAVFRY